MAATTTISSAVREIMVKNKFPSADYRIYMGWAVDAVSKYRMSYNIYSEQRKIELDTNLSFPLPCDADGIVKIKVPFQGRFEELWELPDMVDTTTMVNGVTTRLKINGEGEPVNFNTGDAMNPFGYYSVENNQVFVITDNNYPYIVLEMETNGLLSGESLIPKRYRLMIERYVMWMSELVYGTNKSDVPYYQKLYDEEATTLRNAEERMTLEEFAATIIHGTFDRM